MAKKLTDEQIKRELERLDEELKRVEDESKERERKLKVERDKFAAERDRRIREQIETLSDRDLAAAIKKETNWKQPWEISELSQKLRNEATRRVKARRQAERAVAGRPLAGMSTDELLALASKYNKDDSGLTAIQVEAALKEVRNRKRPLDQAVTNLERTRDIVKGREVKTVAPPSLTAIAGGKR